MEIGFNKKTFDSVKETGKKVLKSAKDNPIATAGLAVSVANLSVNEGRRHQDKKYHQEQAKSTQDLINALKENSETKKSKRILRAGRRYKKVQDSKPLEPTLDESLGRFRGKNFSIESGGFSEDSKDKNRLGLTEKKTVALWTILESDTPTLKRYLRNIAMRSVFYDNSGTEIGFIPSRDFNENAQDFTVNLLCEGGVLVMYIKDPSTEELSILDGALDSYCRSHIGTDYGSEKVGENSYLVELDILHGPAKEFISSISGLKINILK